MNLIKHPWTIVFFVGFMAYHLPMRPSGPDDCGG